MLKGEDNMLKIKKQLTTNIEDLDTKISKLSEELETLELDQEDYQERYEMITQKMETLTDLRCKLAESQVNGSIKPIVASSLLGIASLVIVLKYEEKDVITSKAISMLPGMFRGGK